jgi:hypothetical protein
MKKILLLIAFIFVCTSPCLYAGEQDIQNGDKLQTLTNLHPDMQNRRLYAINYQQPGLIPMCSEVTVKKIKNKVMIFEYRGLEYEYLWDGHTKKAGISLQDNLSNYFGKKCDSAAVKKLSKIDQEGIRTGQPKVGMSKKGITFAMGRPPAHANPDLGIATWGYWRNKFVRQAIDFDPQGKVANIR